MCTVLVYTHTIALVENYIVYSSVTMQLCTHTLCTYIYSTDESPSREVAMEDVRYTTSGDPTGQQAYEEIVYCN